MNDWNVTISEVTIDVFFGVCLDSQWLWLDLGVQQLFFCWLVCPVLLCLISFIIPMVSQYDLSSSNIVLWSWGNLSLIKRCQRSRGWKFSESKHLNLEIWIAQFFLGNRMDCSPSCWAFLADQGKPNLHRGCTFPSPFFSPRNHGDDLEIYVKLS